MSKSLIHDTVALGASMEDCPLLLQKHSRDLKSKTYHNGRASLRHSLNY